MSASEDLAKDKFLSLLENAGKVKFFLLVASFFFLFDSVMVYFKGVGIVGMQDKDFKLELFLGIKLLIIFVCFSGLLSLIFPTVYFLTIQVYELFVDWLGAVASSLAKAVGQRRVDPPFVRQFRLRDCVRPSELRREAHNTQSEFLLSEYRAFSRAQETGASEVRTVQFYAFCALLLAVFNMGVSGDGQAITVIGWIEMHWSFAPVLIGLGTLSVLMLAPVHVEIMSNKWIYCPPLHDRLEQEDNDRYEQQQKFEKELELDVARRKALREQEHSNKKQL
jgi:hypothetical protein